MTNTIERISPPLKWHGGKFYLAQKIVELMPPHAHYVEPYAGGLSVLLAKNPVGVSEVINDLNSDLMNFWGVLQNDGLFREFARIVEATPFSQTEWNDSGERMKSPDRLTRAIGFFIRCRQSMSGRMQEFSPLSRNRVRRGMNEQVSAWLGAVEGLGAVHARLRRVAILNLSATKVLTSQDSHNTLFYLDPPYVHQTRTTTCEYGEYEMTDGDHRSLLGILGCLTGKVLLSGYHSPLYDSLLVSPKWRCVEFDLPNNAAGGQTKRRMTECLYLNF